MKLPKINSKQLNDLFLKLKNKRTLLISFISFFLILLVALIYYIVSYNFAKPITVRVSNLNDKSATISWVTKSKNTGYVLFSQKNDFQNNIFDFSKEKAYDDRDVSSAELLNVSDQPTTRPNVLGKYYVHSVTITNLKPLSTYYFRITNGIQVFDVNQKDQAYTNFDIPTISFFNFETQAEITDISQIGVPQPAYGNLVNVDLNSKETLSEDSLVFIVGVNSDENDSPDDSTVTLPLSTVTASNGSWIVDKSNLRTVTGNAVDTLVNDKDYLYVYTINQNNPPTYGNYVRYGSQDSPTATIKYYVPEDSTWRDGKLKASIETNLNSFVGDLKIVFKAEAVSNTKGVCCILYLNDKNKTVHDYDDVDTCPSLNCEECFKKVFSGSGALCKVEEVKAANRSECEGMKKTPNTEIGKCVGAGIGSSPIPIVSPSITPSPTPSASTYPNPHPTPAPSASTYPNPHPTPAPKPSSPPKPTGKNTCNSKLDDQFLKYASNISKSKFVESAILNASMSQGSGAGLADSCYDFIICKAKKEGVNPEIALSVWFHETFASNYTIYNGSKSGQIEDMGMHCFVGSGKYPEYQGCNTPKENLLAQINMFTDIAHTKCQTSSKSSEFDMNLWGQSFWRGDCTSKYTQDGIDYVNELKAQWSQYASGQFPTWVKDVSKVQPNLDCDVAWNGEDAASGDGSETKLPAEKRVCCAIIKSGKNKFSTDSEVASDCSVFAKDPSLYVVQIPGNTLADCEGKNYEIECSGGKATPKGKTIIGSPSGTVPPICNAQASTGINDVPVKTSSSTSLANFFGFKTYAADFIKTDKTDSYVVLFQENGLYDVEIGDYEIKDLPVNKDSKYRFYVEKNNILGFQEGEDTLVKAQGTTINVVKYEDTFTYELQNGVNFVSFAFVPTKDKMPLKASDLMKLTNINGIKIMSITFFNSGKWSGGIKASLEGSNDFMGNDFTLKPGIGYVISTNKDMVDTATLNIPGNRVTTGVPVVLRSGWNLIGVSNFSEIRSSKILIDSINKLPSTVSDNVTRWNANSSKYEGFQVRNGSEYGTDLKISDKEGYFVRISSFTPSIDTVRAIYWGPGTSMSGKSAE